MQKIKLSKYRIFIVSAIVWLAIDMLTKYYALSNPPSAVFVKNFFYLTLQKNQGIAFGITLGHIVQMIASLIILGLLIYIGFKYILIKKRNSFLNQFLLGIIVGGAFGNLINRIHLGYVIDFIVLRPIPTFNIADIGITVGLIMFFLINLKTDVKITKI